MARTLYLCDPLRNNGCGKLTCYMLNPHKLPGPCRRTTDPRYAMRDADGQPIVMPPDIPLADLREETFDFPKEEAGR